MSAACHARCKHLVSKLPDRYQPWVRKLRSALPALLEQGYPIVPTHGDFNEMNILVDPVTGVITGKVDWSEASMLPFGFSLYALDNCLGSMGANGWRWKDRADELRCLEQRLPLSHRSCGTIRNCRNSEFGHALNRCQSEGLISLSVAGLWYTILVEIMIVAVGVARKLRYLKS